MKKGLFAILAALTVFALVMTGCENESSPAVGDKTYSITFEPNGGTGDAKVVKIVENGYIATASIPKFTRTGYRLSGWSTTTTGSDVDPTAAAVTADASYFALWVQLITITYDKNALTGVGGSTKEVDINSEITIPGSGEAGVSRAGYVFTNWNTAETPSATSTSYDVGAKVTVTGSLTLFAQWKQPTVATTDSIEETLTLGNSWFAVYRFTLPSGKKWSDYKNGGLVASYSLSQALIDNGMARAIRVMGNFTAAEVNGAYYTYAKTQEANVDSAALAASGPLVDLYNGIPMATVAQWQGGNSAPYILSQMGGAWADDNMGTELGKLGITPVADTYFKLSYIIDGSKKNAGHDSAKRLPADNAEGPFYFAIGLPGQNTGNTFKVKDVVLVGTTAETTDVVGMPLYYKNTNAGAGTDNFYRVYNGQYTKDGGNGTQLANWQIDVADKAKLVPIEKDLGAAPTIRTITFNNNYGDTPDTKTLKVLNNEKLGASQLTFPERTGYICIGWFDAQTGGGVLDNTRTISSDLTVYARWVVFVPNTTPQEVSNPTLTKGGTTGPDTADADGWWAMTGNSMLLSYEFPTTTNSKPVVEEFTKVKVDYEVNTGSSNVTDLTASVSVKNGPGSWTTITSAVGPQYPDLTAKGETTGSGSITLNIRGLNNGFALQQNPGNHVDPYNLRITKITFFND